MANEGNAPLEPLCGGELGLRGGTPRSTPGGTSRRRKPNAPRGRPKPINLEVAQNPKISANPRWQDDKCMWMDVWYWTKICEVDTFDEDVFLSANVDRMSKESMGYGRRCHKIFWRPVS